MEKLEIFLLIYILIFYKDIEQLPGKAGTVFYKVIAAAMLLLSIIHICYLNDYLPWQLYENREAAWCNLVFNLAVVLLSYFSIRYMRRKPATCDAEETITPARLRNLLEFYRLGEVKNTLWFVLIPIFIFTKILPDYSLSTSWIVFLGTVAVFMIVYVLYEMQKWIIDNASPFDDVPNIVLNEWLARDSYTEEEQGLLRKRLIGLKLLKEREAVAN